MTSTKIYNAKVCCILCKSEITANNLAKHYKSKQCLKGGKYSSLKECPYCHVDVKSFKNVGSHVAKCNPNKKEALKGRSTRGHKGGNQFTKARKLGLPDPIVSPETRAKISKANIGKVKDDISRKTLSEAMQIAVKNNPESYRGRYNRGFVKEHIVGNFVVLGSWEKEFVEFCINNNIEIEQPKESFPYTFEGRVRQYFPDFFLPGLNLYVEVKGYMNERSKSKIAQFPLRLFVVDKDIINLIKKGEFKFSFLKE